MGIKKEKVNQKYYSKDEFQDKQYKSEKWNNIIFKGLKNQCATVYISGSQNSGKSFLVRQLIDKLGRKQRTRIYYISAIHIIEDKLKELQKDYEVVFYDLNDLYKPIKQRVDIFKEIFDKLMAEKSALEEEQKEIKEEFKDQKQQNQQEQIQMTNIKESFQDRVNKWSQQTGCQNIFDMLNNNGLQKPKKIAPDEMYKTIYDIQPVNQDKVVNGKIVDKSQKDVKSQIIKHSHHDKGEYIHTFIIMDDIPITKQMQNNTAFQTLLKCYRHFVNTMIISTGQDFVLQNTMAIRNLYQIKVFFGNINSQRLKENIYPALRANISYEQFMELYRDATKERFKWIAFDERNGNGCVCQQSFDYVYELPENDFSDKKLVSPLQLKTDKHDKDEINSEDALLQ